MNKDDLKGKVLLYTRLGQMYRVPMQHLATYDPGLTFDGCNVGLYVPQTDGQIKMQRGDSNTPLVLRMKLDIIVVNEASQNVPELHPLVPLLAPVMHKGMVTQVLEAVRPVAARYVDTTTTDFAKEALEVAMQAVKGKGANPKIVSLIIAHEWPQG